MIKMVKSYGNHINIIITKKAKYNNKLFNNKT